MQLEAMMTAVGQDGVMQKVLWERVFYEEIGRERPGQGVASPKCR